MFLFFEIYKLVSCVNTFYELLLCFQYHAILVATCPCDFCFDKVTDSKT